MLARPLLVLALLGVAAGCSSATQPASPGAFAPPQNAFGSMGSPLKRSTASNYIQHVVVIIQENRSFENFFAGFPGANAPTFGYALHSNKRVKVNLHQTTFRDESELAAQLAGRHHGLAQGQDGRIPHGARSNYAAYAYVEPSAISTYWAMAQQYVLADAMFPTEFGGSFTAHLTRGCRHRQHRIPTHAQVNYPDARPNDCDSPPGRRARWSTRIASRHPATARSHASRSSIRWRTARRRRRIVEILRDEALRSRHLVAVRSDLVRTLRPRLGQRHHRAGNQVLTDIRATASSPRSRGSRRTARLRPSGRAQRHRAVLGRVVVNAIGESHFWDSTAIIVLWDDWGGWFDNAAPPQLDFRGLGIRVPCLIISPYAQKGRSSIGLRFAHAVRVRQHPEVHRAGFQPSGHRSGLAGYTDSRANSIIDSFDFTQQPRPFMPFGSKYPKSYFLNEAPSNEPVDDAVARALAFEHADFVRVRVGEVDDGVRVARPGSS